MTQEEFNVVFELQMRKCADILAHKTKECTGDNIDRLSALPFLLSIRWFSAVKIEYKNRSHRQMPIASASSLLCT